MGSFATGGISSAGGSAGEEPGKSEATASLGGKGALRRSPHAVADEICLRGELPLRLPAVERLAFQPFAGMWSPAALTKGVGTTS